MRKSKKCRPRIDADIRGRIGITALYSALAGDFDDALRIAYAKARYDAGRAVFSAFHDAIMSGADDSSGGPPQVVGLYREGPARVFGYVRGGRRYVLGSEAPLSGGACGITWFNGTFERCDPLTGAKLPEAQRQPRPNDLRSRS